MDSLFSFIFGAFFCWCLMKLRQTAAPTAPRWWHCDIHGGQQHAWGCPECLRELRKELRRR